MSTRDHYKGVPKTADAIVGPDGMVSALGDKGASAPMGPYFFFAPGHPDGPGGNRYTSWESLYEAVTKIKRGGVRAHGKVTIEFDLNHNGGSFEIPAGTWDVGGTKWTNTIAAGFNRPLVQFADNCIMTGTEVLEIEGYGGFTLQNDSTVSTPFTLKNFFSIAMTGKRTEFRNVTASAKPLFTIASDASFAFIYASANTAGSIGNGAVNPEPVVDAAGKFLFLGLPLSGLDDDVLTDSVGGGAIDMSCRGFTSAGRNGQGTWRQSKLHPSTVVLWEQHAHPRRSVLIRGNRPLGTSLATRVPVKQTPYVAGANELVLVDAAYVGDDITASMTFDNGAATISGADFRRYKSGAVFTITSAGSNNATTFSATADGTSTSIAVSPAPASETISSTANADSADVILPPATPFARGTSLIVKSISDASACPVNVYPLTEALASSYGFSSNNYNLGTAADTGTITAVTAGGASLTVDLSSGGQSTDDWAGYVLEFPNGTFGHGNAEGAARRVILSHDANDPCLITLDGQTVSDDGSLVGVAVNIRPIGADDLIDGGAGPYVINSATVNKSSGVELVTDGAKVNSVGTWWSL